MTKELRMKTGFYMGNGKWMDDTLRESKSERISHMLFSGGYEKAVAVNNRILLALVSTLVFISLAFGTQLSDASATLFAKPDISGNSYEYASPHTKSLMRYELTH